MIFTLEERNKVIEDHMKLITYLARKMSRDFEFQKELVNEGVIGAINGLEKYEENKTCTLASYIGMCALNSMRKYITFNSDLLRICKKSATFAAIKLKLRNEDTFNWSHKDIENFCEKFGYKFKDVFNVYSATQFGQLHEDIIDFNQELVYEEIERKDILDKIKEFTDSLPKAESDGFYFVHAGVSNTNNLSIKHKCHRNKFYSYARKVKKNLDNYLQLKKG